MVIEIPKGANTILKTLNEAGYEAFVVGGCVRDALLGKKPVDWDITTSADPTEVKKLFKRTVDTGLVHGTVTVLTDGDAYEVTTYRLDGEYEDGRHPKEVQFTRNLTEDLKRRDFTINAMAYHPEVGLVDIFEGQKDLEDRIIRAVGDATMRFSEDALRMMRAIRFAAQLDFTIEEETYKAIGTLAENLAKVSAERIQVELVKCLSSAHPEKFRHFYVTGLTKVFLPEFDRCMETTQNNPHHCYSVGEHILKAIEGITNEPYLRLTMLLHDIAKPVTKTTDKEGIDHFHGHQEKGAVMAGEILRRLHFDNDTIRKVKVLVEYHDARIVPEKVPMRRAIHKIGEDYFPALFDVAQADLMAQSMYQRAEKISLNERRRVVFEEIMAEKDCVSLKTLAVTGKDLIAAGMAPGKQLGEVLNTMLEDVLEEPSHNNKDYLMKRYGEG